MLKTWTQICTCTKTQATTETGQVLDRNAVCFAAAVRNTGLSRSHRSVQCSLTAAARRSRIWQSWKIRPADTIEGQLVSARNRAERLFTSSSQQRAHQSTIQDSIGLWVAFRPLRKAHSSAVFSSSRSMRDSFSFIWQIVRLQLPGRQKLIKLDGPSPHTESVNRR